MAMSRRAFFEKLGAFGGASLMMMGLEAFGMGLTSTATAPPVLQGGGAGKRVIVLGAGVAGLTAAYELERAGYVVSVIEARAFAGGRSQTSRRGFELTELGGERQVCDFDEGQYFNHGPWRVPFSHHSTVYYMRQFGIAAELFNNDNDSGYAYFTKGEGPLANRPVRKMEIAADMRGHSADILAKLVQSGQLDQQFTAADKERFVAYLASEGYLTGDTKDYRGTNGRGWLVQPGAGFEPGKASQPYGLLDVLHSNAWGVLSSVPEWDAQRTLFQPQGGMDRLPKSFAERLGDKIHYATVVEKIRQSKTGVAVSVVDAKGQRETLQGDWCVCTIPLSVLKTIDNGLSAGHRAAMDGAAYHPVGKIGLQMKRRFWEEDHGIYGGHIYTDNDDIGAISLPSSGLFSTKGVVLGYYQGGINAAKISALSLAERARFATDFGQKIFPQYAQSVEGAFSVAWHRVPYSLGGWAEWDDASRERDYPVLLRPDNRIYLAGEHLSYLGGWQAGAIESAWAQIAALHQRATSAA
jgi:monoamine oxidase